MKSLKHRYSQHLMDGHLRVPKNAIEHLEPCYHSNAEEADTRIWLHVKHSAGNRKLIFSPDNDVYHIGLTNAFIASNDN